MKSTKAATALLATAGLTLPPVLATVPGWLRRAISSDKALVQRESADLALITGAAIGALDAMVRHQTPWQGLWRQRLALAAAAATARQVGRSEDEAGLRDAVLLTRPGDEPGPGGRLLLGWQYLASQPASACLTPKSLGIALKNFGYAHDDDIIAALASEIRPLAQGSGMAGQQGDAFALAQRHGLGPVFGAYIADALLAQRLGWDHALPLLGAQGLAQRRGSRRVTDTPDEEQHARLLMAQARAALDAIDLSLRLAGPAQRLIAIAPKLRAKAANSVVRLLLSEDAIVASRQVAGITDRGLRRLFDRLIELNGVRELTGRPTFRIYGL